MATTPAYGLVDEEELMSLKSLVETEGEADEVHQDMAEDMGTVLRRAADLEHAVEVLSSEELLAWAEDWEHVATQTAETMADQVEGIRRGVAVLETMPGEEAVAAELRRHAGMAAERRAEAERIVAAARRLQEKELRRLAAQEHVVVPARMSGLLRAASGDQAAAEELEMEMATLALRLTLGAAEFAERPGEEALVAVLRRQSARASAAQATVEAFRASMRPAAAP